MAYPVVAATTGFQIRDKGFPLSALEYWARQASPPPILYVLYQTLQLLSVHLYNYAVSSDVSPYIFCLLCVPQKFLYSIKRAWSAKSFLPVAARASFRSLLPKRCCSFLPSLPPPPPKPCLKGFQVSSSYMYMCACMVMAKNFPGSLPSLLG